MSIMWRAMCLLYPELWEKYGEAIPIYEELEQDGFPKDPTTNYFMEWLDASVDCNEIPDSYPQSSKKIACMEEVQMWEKNFKGSITNPIHRYVLDIDSK